MITILKLSNRLNIDIPKIKGNATMDNKERKTKVAAGSILIPLAASNVGSKTIHETVLNNFNKTSTGKIFEQDIKDVYSMMIICLKLKDTAAGKHKFNLLNKSYPYSFYVDRALEAMKSLSVSIELSETTTKISYRIQPELGLALLKKFYDAKLLHSPADRTRSKPKINVALQPTPKGVAILQEFCKKIGMRRDNLPPILYSSFNSMDLFKFDRDSMTDKILYSDYFLHLLFIKLMGNKPNIWSSSNKPDELPLLDEKLKIDEAFDFNMFGATVDGSSSRSPKGFNIDKLINTTGSRFSSFSSLTSAATNTSRKSCESISPFHHRYFTNPESDSHIQYYVSTKGVRLYKDKIFTHGNEEVVIEHCITGKAICQWLCDCTDVISNRHAIEIADLILKANLIEPINIVPSIANNSKFQVDRKAFYVLSELGQQVVYWDNNKRKNLHAKDLSNRGQDKVNCNSFISESVDSFGCSFISDINLYPQSNEIPNILLKDILKDPGMRYVFKNHLQKEFCSENLEAYLQLKQYEKKTHLLGKLLNIKNCTNQKLNKQIIRQANICLSLAYHIFFTYLSSEAPYVLNIDYNLRAKITAIMTNPESSTSLLELSPDYLNTPTISKAFNLQMNPKENLDKNLLIFSPPALPPPVFIPDLTLKQSKERRDSIAEISADANIARQDVFYKKHDLCSLSATERTISITLNTLVQISSIFEDIINHIYRLMEVDSFPKFIKSSLYKEATSTIDIRKS